jgi:hypothetical protein
MAYIVSSYNMNLFTTPYFMMGAQFGGASIFFLAAGIIVSWRFGIKGTLIQQVSVVLLGLLIQALSSSGSPVSGVIMGIGANFGILPFNLLGFAGRFLTNKNSQRLEASAIRSRLVCPLTSPDPNEES